MKAARPDAQIKAFTMIELAQIARVAKRSLAEVLPELQAAGLAACPRGGAEVFSDRVHEELFRAKLDNDGWFKVARTVHRAGIRSNVTMLYGHIETVEEKVRHLLHVRELQDETGGFMCFVPLAFDPSGTELGTRSRHDGVRESAGDRRGAAAPGQRRARQSLLDHDHAGRGPDGARGTAPTTRTEPCPHYEITHALGTRSHRQVLTVEQLLDLSREVGRVPVERDALYNVIEQPSAFSAQLSALKPSADRSTLVADR
ncbi:MAG: hypothetical protein MZW92_38620 [Comamonadaceae bacterium]|nr:hypothetical protein [Comamonadaceae bacterium]